MMKKPILFAAIGVVVVGGLFLALGRHRANPISVATAPAATSPSTAPTNKVKLSDSDYATSAYLIAPGTASTDAKQALDGFDMQTATQADGSIKVTLTAKRSGYSNQAYTVTPGQKLYFIETSMGDDGPDFDENLGDDTAVLVDQDGYIVSS